MSLPVLSLRADRKVRDASNLIALWLAYMLVIEGVSWVLLHDAIHKVVPEFEANMHHFGGPASALPSLCRWDCAWYVSIAEGSYPGPENDNHAQLNVAFFPLYGLAMRVVAKVFHISAAYAGAWISRFATLGSMALLREAGRAFGLNDEERWAAVVALLFSPDAFVLLAGYADGLFLFLSLAAFVLAIHGHPLLASIPAACAGLTRIHAFALVAGLGALGVSRFLKAPSRRRGLIELAPALACGLAILGLVAYLKHTTNDPLAFIHQQLRFGKTPGGPVKAWKALVQTWRDFMPPDSVGNLYWGLQAVVAAVWCAILVGLAKTKSWVLLVYAGAAYAMVLTSGTHWGAWRYLVQIFPVWFVVARLQKWRGPWSGLLFAGAVVQICFLMSFVSMRGPGGV